MREVLATCVAAADASGGTLYVPRPRRAPPALPQHPPREPRGEAPRCRTSRTTSGWRARRSRPAARFCREIPERPEAEWNPFERALGVPVRSMVAVPLAIDDEQEPIGVVQLINKTEGAFTDNDTAVLDTVASVATMAYRNARMSEEMARASTLLGMGKVSHDIGNLRRLDDRQPEPRGDGVGRPGVPAPEGRGGRPDRGVHRDPRGDFPGAPAGGRPDRRLLAPHRRHVGGPGGAPHDGARPDGGDDRDLRRLLGRRRAGRTTPRSATTSRRTRRPPATTRFSSSASSRTSWATRSRRCGRPCPTDRKAFGEVAVRYRFDGSDHVIEVHDSGPGMTEEDRPPHPGRQRALRRGTRAAGAAGAPRSCWS